MLYILSFIMSLHYSVCFPLTAHLDSNQIDLEAAWP